MSRRNAQRGKRADWLLLLLIIPGLLSALALGARRHGIEAGNRSVELVLDYAELQSLSVASGAQIPAILERFKTAGVTGAAISEDMLGDLAETGQVAYIQRDSDAGPLTTIRIPDKRLAARVFRALNARLAPGTVLAARENTLTVHAAPATLNTMGLGLSPDAVRLVQESGLDVVARLQNHSALTETAVEAAMAELKQTGVTRLICTGEDVFGFRGLVPYVARCIKSSGLVFGSIEFAKQKGDAQMCEELDSEFIRVHGIPLAEMAGMTPRTAVERFARAVKERNIRLCYVRLPETSGGSSVENGLAFVSAISRDIQKVGYQPGTARPFGNTSRPRLLLALIALSIAAGAVLLLGSLVSLSPAWRCGLLIIGVVGASGLALVGETGRQVLALVSALVFPTLGITALIGPHFNRRRFEKSAGPKAAALFIGASAITLCGAALVMGLLADRSYMVKVNQFVGVKAAHLLPILAVIFIMAAGLPIYGKPFSKVWEEATANIRKVVSHPLFVWHALVVVIALGIIGFALLRTGNDAGVGVTGIELKFRSILDRLMTVRPRTKEFLIGHPALLIGTALLLTRRRAWGLPLVALGVLGQVSLLNTFCHIHTPLNVSALRALNGLALGLVLGIAAWYIAGILSRPRGVGGDPTGKS